MDDLSDVVTLILAAIAAFASSLGAVFAYLNHRDTTRSELPEINTTIEWRDNSYYLKYSVEPWISLPTGGTGFFSSSQKLYHWRIMAVEVERTGLRRKKWLARPMGDDVTTWLSAISYKRPRTKGEIQIHPDCSEAEISFICTKSSLKRSVKHQYVRDADE